MKKVAKVMMIAAVIFTGTAAFAGPCKAPKMVPPPIIGFVFGKKVPPRPPMRPVVHRPFQKVVKPAPVCKPAAPRHGRR